MNHYYRKIILLSILRTFLQLKYQNNEKELKSRVIVLFEIDLKIQKCKFNVII